MKANTKYLLILLASIALLGALFYMSYSSEGFEDSPSFTMYYADWCPHCKTVKPIFEEWKKNGSMTVNGKEVRLSMVESSDNKDKSVPVKGFPTFLLKTGGAYKEFSGDRTPSGWESWLKENM